MKQRDKVFMIIYYLLADAITVSLCFTVFLELFRGNCK